MPTPPLYVTNPARHLARIEDHTERARAASEALTERRTELAHYVILYAEQYGHTLDLEAVATDDATVEELTAIIDEATHGHRDHLATVVPGRFALAVQAAAAARGSRP